MSVNVPDDDLPRVRVWLGQQSANGVAEASDTLLKRLTSAAIGGLKNYLAAASEARCFTAPFRAGVALRKLDGSLVIIAEETLFADNAETPLLAANELKLAGNSLTSVNEIYNSPKALTLKIAPFELTGEIRSAYSDIVVFASTPAEILPSSTDVVGLRSQIVNGSRLRVWAYPSRSTQDIIADARGDEDLRILGTVSLDSVTEGYESTFPAYGNISSWKSFPKFTLKGTSTGSGGGSGSSSGSGSGGEGSGGEGGEGGETGESGENVNPIDPLNPYDPEAPWLKITTGALDLGDPEMEKWLRGVMLRGVFSRNVNDVKISVWGSHHRENWRYLGTSRGAIFRRLRGIRFRWYRVEITMLLRDSADHPEALVFDIIPR